MANSRELQGSPEVAAFLPAEVLARFCTDPDYEALTCICGQAIAPGGPAALVVLRDNGTI
jgi:hypothetical protein